MPNSTYKVFACAGETSGDRILAEILKMLKSGLRKLEIKGIGGCHSINQGLKSLAPIQNTAVSGIGDVLFRLPPLLRLLNNIKKEIRRWRPDIVILVDYPGLNLRLLKLCSKVCLPVYYVCPPQAWAYKHKNLSCFNLIPVQVSLYRDAPLYQSAGACVSQGHFFKIPDSIPSNRSHFLVCPGSRAPVMKRNLPALIRLAEQKLPIQKRSLPALILIPSELETEAETILNRRRRLLKWSLITESERAFRLSSHAVAFPGTVTAELALWHIPTLVFGIVEPLTWLAGNFLLKTRWTALPNILCGREMFPEVLSWRTPPQKLVDTKLLDIFKKKVNFTEFSKKLGPGRGSLVALDNILKLMNSGK